MYYSFYQKKTLDYFFQKIKVGKKNNKKNDIQRLNLKGKIKSYKVISSKENLNVIEEIIFDKKGNFITYSKKDECKIYNYKEDSKLSSCETFIDDKLILTEFFKYDQKGKLVSKKIFEEINIQNNCTEYYEYDLRENITAIIKQYDLDDVVQTNKYNKSGSLTDSFYFTNKKYEGCICVKIKNTFGGKIKSITSLSSENDTLIRRELTLNEKGDVISELFYNVFKYQFDYNPTSTFQFIYKYDKFENWITRSEYFNGDLKEELTTEIEYFK